MNVRYRVDLSQIERTELRALLKGGKHASRKLKRIGRSSGNGTTVCCKGAKAVHKREGVIIPGCAHRVCFAALGIWLPPEPHRVERPWRLVTSSDGAVSCSGSNVIASSPANTQAGKRAIRGA